MFRIESGRFNGHGKLVPTEQRPTFLIANDVKLHLNLDSLVFHFLTRITYTQLVLSWFVFFARDYSKSFKSFFEFQPLSRESAFFWKLEIFPRNFDIYMQQQGKKWDQITALLAGEELLPNLI